MGYFKGLSFGTGRGPQPADPGLVLGVAGRGRGAHVHKRLLTSFWNCGS